MKFSIRYITENKSILYFNEMSKFILTLKSSKKVLTVVISTHNSYFHSKEENEAHINIKNVTFKIFN